MTSKNVAQAEGILRFPLEEKQFVFSYKKVVIMKKTLAAVAVLGAFAGSALAADVTLYGKVDLGLQYMNTNTDQLVVNGVDIVGTQNVKKDSWGMKSGSNSGSRFGLKGAEQISDDLTVGFQLEQGFNADDGTLGADGLAFNREARLYVQTAFGEIGLGRMGGLDSGLGSYDIISKGYAFGTGWGSTIADSSAILLGESSRFDNMITYKSPTFAGVTVLAQASLAKTSVEEGEGTSDVDRYYALGATGNWGALSSALIFSTTDYSRTWVNAVDATSGVADKEAAKAEGREDMSKVLTGYVSYDFGVVKPMLAAQYFDDLKGMSVSAVLDEDAKTDGLNAWLANISKKGYGVLLGATAPLGAGTLFASVGYNDFESTVSDDLDGKIKFDTVQFGIGYQYPLSKRTYVYTAAGYTKLSGDFKEDGKKYDPETKTTEVVAGIVHNF